MIIKKQFLLNKDILSDGNHPLHPKSITGEANKIPLTLAILDSYC